MHNQNKNRFLHPKQFSNLIISAVVITHSVHLPALVYRFEQMQVEPGAGQRQPNVSSCSNQCFDFGLWLKAVLRFLRLMKVSNQPGL